MKTEQLSLLDFNVLAEEIKTLTQNILKNRWEIAEKLFYIKENWDEYKKQPDFIYKSFKQFIADYYHWTKKEAYLYIQAHQYKLLLLEKSNTGVTLLKTLDISTAFELNKLAGEDEHQSIEIIEEKPDITRKEVEEKIKEVKQQRESSEGEHIKISDKDHNVFFGDFKTELAFIPDNNIDLILTDPPYPHEYIDCWSELAEFAEKKLKPSGLCIAYSPHIHLVEIVNRMSENLIYFWVFCLYQPGGTKIVEGRNIMAQWKPILVFQKAPFKKLKTVVPDYYVNEKAQKGLHKWQQGESATLKLIECFSKKKDIIIDPFVGSGTTLVCAKKLGRRCLGAEIEKETFNIAKKRLSEC